MLGQFLMELEWEQSAPANGEILSEGFFLVQCRQPGSTPTRTVLPIVAVAKLVVPKIADYRGRPGGRRFRLSRHDRRKAARVQWHWSDICVAQWHLK